MHPSDNLGGGDQGAPGTDNGGMRGVSLLRSRYTNNN
jgi:hypothetical protein